MIDRKECTRGTDFMEDLAYREISEETPRNIKEMK
jgi:hypothetical protein